MQNAAISAHGLGLEQQLGEAVLGDQLGIFTDEAGFEGTVDDEDRHGDAVGVEDLDRTPIGLCQSDVVDLAGFNDAAGQPNLSLIHI